MVETGAKNDAPLTSAQQIYNQICAACHGINRQGDPTRAYPTLVKHRTKTEETGHPSIARFRSRQHAGFCVPNQTTERDGGGPSAQPGTARAGRPPGDISVGGITLNEPYTHTGYNRWLDTNGYPAVKPPWGTLNAIDLNTGDYKWRIPLGEVPALTARGIPPTGTENYGGPVDTATGSIFIAATKDEMIRAFDEQTGKVLWQSKLPAGGYATPATYLAQGRQFLVIACGGGKMGTRSGDAYVAFALPRRADKAK